MGKGSTNIIEHTIISPTGEEFSFCNIKKFSQEHGLLNTGICSLVNGVFDQYKGWKRKEPLTMMPVGGYRFISPAGDLIITGDLKELSRNSGVRKAYLYKLAIGVHKISMGWTMAPDDVDITKAVPYVNEEMKRNELFKLVMTC